MNRYESKMASAREAVVENDEIRQAGHVDEYDSAFEYDSEHERKLAKRRDLTSSSSSDRRKTAGVKVKKNVFTEEYSKNEAIPQRYHQSGLDAYTRHKQLINDYILYYKGATSLFRRDTSRDRTDLDVIRENHRFLWSEDDDVESTWGRRMAKKYYDKLFKEYCIADLSRYKENKVAMRWRVEKEVADGKGQFVCGSKSCMEKDGLRSWEVNFGYVEAGEKKNALIKLRLCSECSFKLNYRHKRKEATKAKKRKKSVDGDDSDDVTAAKISTMDDGKSEKESDVKADEAKESELWKVPVKLDEKSRDEEFDDYFGDLFL